MQEHITIGAGTEALSVPRIIVAGPKKTVGDLEVYDSPGVSFAHWRPCPSVGPDAVPQVLESAISLPNPLLQYTAWRYDVPSYIDNLWHLTRRAQVGVVDFDAAHLKLLVGSGIPVVSNTVSASILDTRYQALAEAKSDFGLAVMGYGAELGGFVNEAWVGAAAPGMDSLAPEARAALRTIEVTGGWELFQSLMTALGAVGKRHGASLLSVAISYLLATGIDAVIVTPTSTPPQHLSLSEDDLATISAAQAALHPLKGGCGDHLRHAPFLTPSGGMPALADFLGPRRAALEKVIAAGGRGEYSSGSPWEPVVGYCRAVRYGDRIIVSGTTTRAHPSGTGVLGRNAEDQATFVFDIIRGALYALGGSLGDVVRTRILYTHVGRDWLDVGKVQAREFALYGVVPANTMVGGLSYVVGKDALLEIEAEAVIGAGEGEVFRIDPRHP